MSMFDRLGLGIEVDLQDNLTNRINPLITDLDRLQRAARQTTNQFDTMGHHMSGFGRNLNYGQYRNFYSSMQSGMRDMGRASLQMSRNLIQATMAMNNFRTASNSLQSMGQFNRAYSMVMSTQNMMGMMGFGMSRMQEHRLDLQAYNMLNYTIKDLNDKIKLTEKGIKQMMASPDAHKFTEQISLARRSLSELQNQLRQTNAQEQILRTFGMQQTSFLGRNIYYRPNENSNPMSAVANRLLSASYNDVAYASMRAYQSLDKTAKMMVGTGYTTMEMRQKITALTMTMTMAGQALSMYITAPLMVASAAIGAFVNTYEKATSMFQARTLMPNVDMSNLGGYRQQMREVWAKSGASFGDVSDTMSQLANSFPSRNSQDIAGLTSVGLKFHQVWNQTGAVDSIMEVDKMMKKFGVTSSQAFDILTLGLKHSNGDLQGADTYIQQNIKSLKDLTSAGKDGSQAFEQMTNAMNQTPTAKLIQGFRSLANIFLVLWDKGGLGDIFGRIGDGMTKLGNSVSKFLENNPEMAKFISYATALTGIFAMTIGPIMLVTGYLIQYRNVLQGTAITLKTLGKGMGVLPAEAVLAREKLQGVIVAIARFPQTLAAIGGAVFGIIRMIPQFALEILKVNPMLAVAGLAVVAYANNWGGLRDTVKDVVGGIKGYIVELREWLIETGIAKAIDDTIAGMKMFWKGFGEGIGVVIDFGKQFFNYVIQPIKDFFKTINPYIKNFAKEVSKMFGGDGDLKSGLQTWEAIGKAVGIVVGGFILLKGIGKITAFLVSPFKKMNESVMNVGTSLDRVITRLEVLGRTAARTPATIGTRIRNAAQTVGNYLYNNPNAALQQTSGYGNGVVQQQGLVQRSMSALMLPFNMGRGLLASGLASMGIGRGVAMGRQMTSLRQRGLALRENSGLLNYLNNRMMQPFDRNGNAVPRISSRGTLGGRTVYQARQTAIGRALFGTRMYTYDPVRNQAGQITGYQRNNAMTTGGLLRSATGGFFGLGNTRFGQALGFGGDQEGVNRRSFGQRMVDASRTGLTTTGRFLRSNPLTRAMGATFGGWGRAIGNPIQRGFRRFTNNEARGFDRLTQNRFARGMATAGRWAGGRLEAAGIRNPFAGMLSATGAQGPMTRMQRTGNFIRTGIRGTGSLAWGATRGMARGTMAVGRAGVGVARMGARGVGAIGRGIGRIGGGLLNAAPMLMMGGMLGKMAYDKLAVGKDGKKSAGNIAGNIDKITANIGKGGSKGISEFWNKFKKYGSDIMKSVIKLIEASWKALAPKLPGMLKDAWNGIKALAKAAWDWIKTDGVKMAQQVGQQIVKLLGQAWNWIKTDGVKYWGQLWSWLVGTATPKAADMLMKLLGKALHWVATDGMSALGKLIGWIITVAIPKIVTTGMSLLGKLFKWIFTDGIKIFGELVVGILKLLGDVVKGAAKVGVEIGKAIWNGIKGALSGLGNFILGLISKIPGGDKVIEFLGGAKKHARGGIINSPHLGMVGEAGPEAIIPLSGNMRGIAGNLLKQTAGLLGFNVSKTGQQVPAYATGGVGVGGKLPVKVGNTNKNTPTSQDNSVTIQKLEINFPKDMASIGVDAARQQVDFIMKEMKKKMRSERLRQGNKNLSLEDVILGN
jgi:hypothetical protein